jgi:hypothetical protein
LTKRSELRITEIEAISGDGYRLRDGRSDIVTCASCWAVYSGRTA